MVRAMEQSGGQEMPSCLPPALQQLADGDQIISTSRFVDIVIDWYQPLFLF